MKTKQLHIIPVLFLLTLCLNSCDRDEPVPDNNSGDKIYTCYITGIVIENSNLWIGTLNSGLYKFNGNSWSSYTTTDGLVNDTIRALTVDNDGNIWIGTIGGISKFDGTEFTNYTESEGLFSNDVRSLATDQQNNILIGTIKNRISIFDGSAFTHYHVCPLVSQGLGHIHALSSDLNGNIWIGSCISGLSKFDGTNWTHNINDLNSFVEPILCTSTGDVWIGHYTGAYIFSNNTWTNYTESDGLISNNVMSFTIDHSNNVWTGTDSGLCKYDGTSWTCYTTKEGLPGNDISALVCDQNGDIWVGSSEGLTKLSD